MDDNKQKPALKLIVNNAARRDAAISANARLKKERLSESDRMKFAKNLGNLFEKCQKRVPSLTLSQLFVDAFGERSGESAYKKRNRLITLSKDKSTLGTLSSLGNQYRLLAISLSQYIELPENTMHENPESIAILRLIEGSSFDISTAHMDRFNQEFQVEIGTQLRRLTKRIVENVDLDWMRTWSEIHYIPIQGETGKVTEIRSSTINHSSSYRLSAFSLNGQIQNAIAPCVRIGHVTSRRPIKKYIDIKMEGNTSTEGKAHAILQKWVDLIKIDTPLDGMKPYEFADKLVNCDLWKSNNNFLNGGYNTERVLDLEIRFDVDSDEWYPCLLLRFNVSTADTAHGDFRNALPGMEILFADYETECICVAKPLLDNKYRIFLIQDPFYIGNSFDDNSLSRSDGASWNSGQFLGLNDNDGVHPLESRRYFNLLLNTGYGDTLSWDFKPALADPEKDVHTSQDISHFVKAPKRSIAYYMLHNLAYAPLENRLDHLLIIDAKKKHAMLKQYSDRVTKEYEEAISKL